MATRVVATDTAVQTIKQMKGTIDGDLTQAFGRLRSLAQVLHDTNHWDGDHANNFKGNVWPGVDRSMSRFSEDLEQLRTTIDAVLASIMQAGGNA